MVDVQALSEKAIVPAMQRNKVVVDAPSKVDLTVQVLGGFFGAIEFKRVCSHEWGRLLIDRLLAFQNKQIPWPTVQGCAYSGNRDCIYTCSLVAV